MKNPSYISTLKKGLMELKQSVSAKAKTGSTGGKQQSNQVLGENRILNFSIVCNVDT